MDIKELYATTHSNMKKPCDGAIRCYPADDVDAYVKSMESEIERLNREVRRTNKVMYRALFNWCQARAFIYMFEHKIYTIPEKWKMAMDRCKICYDVYKWSQEDHDKNRER